MKQRITFKNILEQLGCNTPTDFYKLMKPHWGGGADAILTFNPVTKKPEIGSIYSNDWFNPYTKNILLARLNLSSLKDFNRLWEDIYYDIEMSLEREIGKETSNEEE